MLAHRPGTTTDRWMGQGALAPRRLRFEFQRADVRLHSRGTILPEVFVSLSLEEKREQGMPDARCTRGLVCFARRARAVTQRRKGTEETALSLIQFQSRSNTPGKSP
jgi:hypothetical protein